MAMVDVDSISLPAEPKSVGVDGQWLMVLSLYSSNDLHDVSNIDIILGVIRPHRL